MNRILKHTIFLSILLIPLFSTGVGFARSQVTPTVTINNKSLDPQVNPKIQPLPKLAFFDKQTGFTNQTKINVTRNVLVNNWGYVEVTDKVSMFTNTTELNAFNYTLPTLFYQKIDHIELKISQGNTTTHELARYINPLGENYTVITFKINETASIVNTTFSIVLGVNDLVSVDKSNLVYPFEVSGVNFLPFFDFPMTQYNFIEGVISYDQATSIENTTYVPDPTTLGITATKSKDFATSTSEITYSTMNQLSNFNYTVIKNNYQSIGKSKFIPGFDTQFASNFTYGAQFRFVTAHAPVEYTSAKVTITIGIWGEVTYDEQLTLFNKGINQTFSGTTNNFIPIWINANKTTSIMASDYLGNLTKTTSTLYQSGQGFPLNSTLVQISPRSTIQGNSSYTFELKYTIPTNIFMADTGGFFNPSYNLSLPAMSMFNWTNRHVDLTVIFPALSSVTLPSSIWGVPVSGANMTNDGLFGMGSPVLHLNLYNFSMLDNVFEKLKVSLPPVLGQYFSVFENAVLLFFIGLLIILVRIGMQRFSHIVETTSVADSQIPFELMRDFVTAYEEKTALRSRLADLEKKKKNLRKVEYEQLVQTLKNKQMANDKKLISVTSELVKVSAVYKESIRNLELAEAERDQILTQIADLDEKKKQSRIRPEIYNKLKNEQNSRLNKSISKIERVLNELRSLLREAK